jgi:rfaE bifunctional protein kinase chain/domain
MRDAIAQLRVLVVGDVMLDEYWFGDVNRISPEAPVPVVKVKRSDQRPGGAANVARNIAALGAQTSLLSIVGRDDRATDLRVLLDRLGIVHHLQEDATIRTTLKLRVIGHQQQMLRIDFEEHPARASLDAKQSRFRELLPDHDVVVFSDYRKGALDRVGEMVQEARAQDRLIVVDPKGTDYDRYAGATVITPNRSELAAVAGAWNDEAGMDAKAQQLRQQLGLEKLLLTMSEQGLKLYGHGAPLQRAPEAQEVYDVSGAGDTVVAAVAVLRGVGASWEDTVDFANSAAGIVVSRLGTSFATLDEVVAALGDRPGIWNAL